MLSDFFRINLPYGMVRDKGNKWMVFNREYKPIGFNRCADIPNLYAQNGDTTQLSLPVYVEYKGLTERLILEIAKSIRRDENDKIYQFWLYNDKTNPMNNNDWVIYWGNLQKLAKLQRSNKKK